MHTLLMPANQTAAADPLTTCPKCEGSGKFTTYSPYTGRASYVGKCWDCQGSGKVLLSTVANSEAARLLTGNIIYTVQCIINPAAADGNTSRVEFYMSRIIKRMFLVGKPNARKVLDALAEGIWHDDNAPDHESTRGRLDPKVAAGLRARCIEMAREVLAQDEDRCQDSADLEAAA